MSDESSTAPAPPEPPQPPPPAAPEPDREPGNPTLARLAGLAVLLLIAVVAGINQYSLSAAAQEPEQAAAAAIEPPDFQSEFTARITTKIALEWGDFGNMAQDTVKALDAAARTPADRLRAAIVAGEVLGPEEVTDRLDQVEEEAPEDSPLVTDIDTVRRIYLDDEVPADAELEALKTNHGWFGRLAASRTKGDADPGRQRMVSGGGSLLILLFGLAGGACLGLVVGFVLLILGIIRWATDPRFLKFRPRAPGGSVLIETVAIFVAGFLAMKLVADLIAMIFGEPAALPFTLVAQWALLTLVLWGWFRGMPARTALADLGWHRGRGVLTEIGCGIVGYLSCLPLLAAGALTTLVLIIIDRLVRMGLGAPESPPPSNKVLEVLGSQHGTWMLVVFFMLATAWAPLAEESIFRGALFGHLRRRWHWFPAAAVTALGFGLMHGYPLILLGPVIALGFGFALIREWRGSLIACATAHALHNGAVLILLLTLLRMLED